MHGALRRNHGLAASLVLTCGLLLASTPEVQAQQATPQGIFVSDTGSGDDIKAAIEAATAKMGFVARSAARNRLGKTNLPYQKIEIFRGADQVTIKFDKGKPIATPTDGRSVKWTREDGEELDVTGAWRDFELVQTFTAGDGQRVNTFSLSPDGRKLKLQVLLSSPQLAAPITYTLMFRRWAMGDK